MKKSLEILSQLLALASNGRFGRTAYGQEAADRGHQQQAVKGAMVGATAGIYRPPVSDPRHLP